MTASGPVLVSIFGGGLGATYLGPTGSLDTNYVQLQHSTKHYTYNTYLAMLLRMGLLGLLAMAAFVICYLWTAVSAWRRLASDWPRACAVTAAGCLIGVAAMSYVDPYLLAHPVTMFEGVTIGMLVAAGRAQKARSLDSGR